MILSVHIFKHTLQVSNYFSILLVFGATFSSIKREFSRSKSLSNKDVTASENNGDAEILKIPKIELSTKQ
jgi:hypothetical protein